MKHAALDYVKLVCISVSRHRLLRFSVTWFLLPYYLFQFCFLFYSVICFCTFSWSFTCFILFVYFFQSVFNYCHFRSSFYPPTFDLVLLSRLLPPVFCIWSSPNSCPSSFSLFRIFLFICIIPLPFFSCLLSSSVLFPYSSLFCLITCLFSTCFLFIILLVLLSFLICIWSPVLLSFRVHTIGLSLRAPSPWSNDRFFMITLMNAMLSALSLVQLRD